MLKWLFQDFLTKLIANGKGGLKFITKIEHLACKEEFLLKLLTSGGLRYVVSFLALYLL